VKIKLGTFSIAPSEAGIFLQTTLGLTSNQEAALKVIQHWESGSESFTLTTSGSVGPAKEIQLSREMLIWSANNTKAFLHLEDIEQILCCLPVNKVGGFMMLIRSLIFGWDINLVEPTSNPFDGYDGKASFVSLVPYQLYQILLNEKSLQKLKYFNVVLIGGAELRPDVVGQLQNWPCRVYHSYGMTETASHIALKPINGSISPKYFSVLPGVEVSTDENSFLLIDIPEFDINLKTRDKVFIHRDGIEIIGREENFINSGGLKLNAVEMEEFIFIYLTGLGLSRQVCAVGKADLVLGEKVILFIEGNSLTEQVESKLAFALEEKYGRYLAPKEIRYIGKLPMVNFKVDRRGLMNWL
jgi:O-succinylbenzoic acid--CoA ligase